MSAVRQGRRLVTLVQIAARLDVNVDDLVAAESHSVRRRCGSLLGHFHRRSPGCGGSRVGSTVKVFRITGMSS